MNIEPLNLESQLKLYKLKLYLKQHPEDNNRLAIKNYEHWLALNQEYKKLFRKYELLRSKHFEFVNILDRIFDNNS